MIYFAVYQGTIVWSGGSGFPPNLSLHGVYRTESSAATVRKELEDQHGFATVVPGFTISKKAAAS